MRPGPIEWALGIAGVGLVVAAVLNKSPIRVALEAATGGDPADVPPIAHPSSTYVPSIITGAGSPSAEVPVGEPDTVGLVGWTDANGDTYKMTPNTRDGMVKWDKLHRNHFGVGLVLTSAYRSAQSQAESHANDPGRFAPATTSWHVKGKAVDVNMPASGVTDAGKVAAYLQLGEAAGWCFAGRSGKMHASYGGCG